MLKCRHPLNQHPHGLSMHIRTGSPITALPAWKAGSLNLSQELFTTDLPRFTGREGNLPQNNQDLSCSEHFSGKVSPAYILHVPGIKGEKPSLSVTCCPVERHIGRPAGRRPWRALCESSTAQGLVFSSDAIQVHSQNNLCGLRSLLPFHERI